VFFPVLRQNGECMGKKGHGKGLVTAMNPPAHNLPSVPKDKKKSYDPWKHQQKEGLHKNGRAF
jgi:hypothetical protein